MKCNEKLQFFKATQKNKSKKQKQKINKKFKDEQQLHSNNLISDVADEDVSTVLGPTNWPLGYKQLYSKYLLTLNQAFKSLTICALHLL